MYDAESLRIDPRAKKPVDADLPAEKVAEASHSKAPLHSVPTPVFHWFLALLLVLFVGGLLNALQSTSRERKELRTVQSERMFDSEENYLPKILFALDYGTPWLAYAFAAWLALCLEKQIAELRKLRFAIESQSGKTV